MHGNTFDVLVIGAGQAGLAAGYHLRRAGLSFNLLEARDEPGGNWPSYYDSLELFSPARYSSLPGLAFPGDPERYPRRDEVTAYLRGYARHFELPVLAGRRVKEVSRREGRFRLTTEGPRGESLGIVEAGAVIVATGGFGRPFVPRLPGEEEFVGRVLHSASYCGPEEYRNQRVVVVGAGNSAVQIAVELAQVARVSLATREPVRFMRQRWLGKDVHFWIRLLRYDPLPLGAWFGFSAPTPVLDQGRYRAALAAGRPERRPMFRRFTARGVEWSDSREEAVDAVILATGFRPHVEFLRGLGALDAQGLPLQRGGVSQTVPGLFYVGQEWQVSHASATLRGVGPDAARVVRRIERTFRAGEACRG